MAAAAPAPHLMGARREGSITLRFANPADPRGSVREDWGWLAASPSKSLVASMRSSR
jgi:hypothetical protein